MMPPRASGQVVVQINTPMIYVEVPISFEQALDAVRRFAESNISGDEFHYRQADQLETAARLIREKINDFKK